ncbi:MAG: hypothetical protein MI673_01055 [Thiotrichales bacterium]|nr:hypothetical protein [Thiotrichales bacterium]
MNRISQRGVSLVTAIFLVVVVASIGAYMVTIGQTQQRTTALSVLGEHGMNAAASGLEWAIHRAVQAAAAGLNCAPGTVNFTPAAPALDNFNVTVTCSVQNFEEGTTNYNVYSLSATAAMNAFGNPDFISRTLRASVCVACP